MAEITMIVVDTKVALRYYAGELVPHVVEKAGVTLLNATDLYPGLNPQQGMVVVFGCKLGEVTVPEKCTTVRLDRDSPYYKAHMSIIGNILLAR